MKHERIMIVTNKRYAAPTNMSTKPTCPLNKPHFACGEYLMIQGADDRLVRCGLCHPSTALPSAAIAKTASAEFVKPATIPSVEVATAKPVLAATVKPAAAEAITVKHVAEIASAANVVQLVPEIDKLTITPANADEKMAYDNYMKLATKPGSVDYIARFLNTANIDRCGLTHRRGNWCGKCRDIVTPGDSKFCQTCGGEAVDIMKALIPYKCPACYISYERNPNAEFCAGCGSVVDGYILRGAAAAVVVELDVPVAFDALIVFYNPRGEILMTTPIFAGESRALMTYRVNANESWYEGEWRVRSIEPLFAFVRRMRITSLRKKDDFPFTPSHVCLGKVSFEVENN